MSVVTKAGALAVLGRFAYAALPAGSANALLLPIWIVAALSMIVGNVGLLAQTDMKRLLAYSGIAQVGYIVAALAGTTALGLRYAIFYLAAYTFMNLGAFAVVALISRDARRRLGLGRLRGPGAPPPVARRGDDVLPAGPGGLAADGRLHRQDPDPRGDRRAPATCGWAAC